MSDNDTFTQGVQLLSKWYNDECRDCARQVLLEARENRELRRDRDENEILQELIDGHEYVIYTFKAQLVVAFSDHSDAYEDELGEKPPTVEAQACMAMIADVREYMDSMRDDEGERA